MIFDHLVPRAAAGETPITTSRELANALGRGYTSNSGTTVSEESAMRVAAVNACVRILSQAYATLPLSVFKNRSDGKGRDEDKKHPLYHLLHTQPNRLQGSLAWRETSMIHMLLRGNAYSLKSFVRGRLDELIPVHPDRVKVLVTPDRDLIYEIAPPPGQSGPIIRLGRDEILHVTDMSTDGLVGRNRIADMREQIGLALATEEHGARAFSNGTRLGLVVKHPAVLGETAYNNLKNDLNNYTGVSNAQKTYILEEGMDVSTVSMSHKDSEFLDSRRFTVEDIARMFGVPPHMLFENTKQTSYGTGVEEMSLGFVKYTLRTVVKRNEQAYATQLPVGPDHVVKANLNALLAGDFKTRQEGLAIQRGNGVINANDWRAKEGLNPRIDGGGEEYMTPLNMGGHNPETTNRTQSEKPNG